MRHDRVLEGRVTPVQAGRRGIGPRRRSRGTAGRRRRRARARGRREPPRPASRARRPRSPHSRRRARSRARPPPTCRARSAVFRPTDDGRGSRRRPSSSKTSSQAWPSCRATVRAISTPLGASGSALFRTRRPGWAAATSTSAAMLAAAVVWSTPAPRPARTTAGRRSSTRFTKTHSRGRVPPTPWTFDGRRTVTGAPDSRRTCSAATLFAP